MTKKTTFTLTDANSAREALNAIRRALSNDFELEAGQEIKIKGVRIKTTEIARVKPDSKAEVRDWARENGFEVGQRGRFSREVLDAYAAAH